MRNEDYRSSHLIPKSTRLLKVYYRIFPTNLTIPLPRLAKIEIQRLSMIPNITLSRRSKKLHDIRIVAPLYHTTRIGISILFHHFLPSM